MEPGPRLFYSPLTNTVYMASSYRLDKVGRMIITGKKWDVTEDFLICAEQMGLIKGRKDSAEKDGLHD